MIARRMLSFPSTGWHHPFAEMDRMIRQMDRFSRAVAGGRRPSWFSSGVFPAVNITEDKDSYYVRAELPGIKADDIDLQVDGKNLMISGERQIASEGGKVTYHRREREAGKFSRIIRLPGKIEAESVRAEMVDGMLTVCIAKSADAKPKQITVKTS